MVKQLLHSPTIEVETPTIRLYTLGTLRVERCIRHGPWENISSSEMYHKRVQMLLASLISTPGRRLGREQLMEVLWPDVDDLAFLQRELDRTVYDVRQLLEPQRGSRAESQLLSCENSILTLADQDKVWLDAECFLQLLQKARITTDAMLRREQLQEAILLYNGDFFLGIVPICIEQYRETLRRSFHSAMLDLSDLWALEQEYFSALMPLNQLLFLDPADEDAALRFLFILAQQCRRSEAIRFYLKFHDRMRSLHIRLHPKMKALYRAIMSGYDETTLQAIARGDYTVGQ